MLFSAVVLLVASHVVGESTTYPCVGAVQPSFCRDSKVTLTSAASVSARRRQLVQWLWGSDSVPISMMPSSVAKNISSPVSGLEGLVARVDGISLTQSSQLTTQSLHFVPVSPNGQAVVLHHGHACTFDDYAGPLEQGYGMQRTIVALLTRGFGVLAVYMPHMQPDDCNVVSHDSMFQNGSDATVMAQFLNQTLVSVNSVAPHYSQFHMAGLSGGGWATTIYPALDQRIGMSFPVAGSIPLYLRSGFSEGDMEQYDPAFYGQSHYIDFYVLATTQGRRSVQILNRHDDCCFGEKQHNATQWGPWSAAMRAYEARVVAAVESIAGLGQFELVIDDDATAHMISHWAIDNVIIPLLETALKEANDSSRTQLAMK